MALCLRDPSCTLNDAMGESLCALVHIVQLIWVGSLQNINVLTKKHVELSFDSISKTKSFLLLSYQVRLRSYFKRYLFIDFVEGEGKR